MNSLMLLLEDQGLREEDFVKKRKKNVFDNRF